MQSETYKQFIALLKETATLGQIAGRLHWDQKTYMPPKAAAVRAEQLAMISGLAHAKFTSEEMGALLDQLAAEGSDDPVVATNVRETKHSYDREVKLPLSLVQEITRTAALAHEAWTNARRESSFAIFAPLLDKMLDLKRQAADKIGWDTEPYDALMDEYEPGAKAAEVQAVFDELKNELTPMVAALKDAPRQPDLSILRRECPKAGQEAFGRRVVELMTFDFEAGRIDETVHPFCSGVAPSDVRLTTRYDEHYFPMSLFGTMHEAGHGLYEQGLPEEHTGTPMGTSVSLGIHESQSRLWENQVGRSRPFWEGRFGEFQQTFPSMRDVALDDFLFAINNVRPSFIRVEADEVTYGLHIMVRFTIEREMIGGKLSTSEVPDRWNGLFKEFFGLTPPDDAQGCLQDVHWSMGALGYFPTYQLGNLYAAQFFAAARRVLPELDDQVRRGELGPLREWLRENIHLQGMRYRAKELVKRVTGDAFSARPFLDYLNAKYRPLYGI